MTMLAQTFAPGRLILVLLFLFMGVGVLTIAMITFLERRRELATLKSIGISDRQVVLLLGIEYGLAGAAGFAITSCLSLLLYGRVAWFRVLSVADMALMALSAILVSALTLVISLLYPVLIAKIATVNQLLFARTIPLRTLEINFMSRPTPDLVTREYEENLRFIFVPFDTAATMGKTGTYLCMLLKEVGQRVKQGEVIASEELYQGHLINNYCAICDGEVISINGALVTVKADAPDSPRYNYGFHMVEEERRRRALVARVRAEERDLLASGGSSTDRRKNPLKYGKQK